MRRMKCYFATERRELKTPLSNEEVIQMAERQAAAIILIQEIGDEIKQFKKERESVKARIESELIDVSRKIRERYEFRQVDCTRIYDYPCGMVYVVRDDRDEDEIVDERKMSAEEKQRPMFPEDIEGEPKVPEDEGGDLGDPGGEPDIPDGSEKTEPVHMRKKGSPFDSYCGNDGKKALKWANVTCSECLEIGGKKEKSESEKF
jgi:hypothetical protein